MIWQYLDSNYAIEALIFGTIDFSHPTHTKRISDNGSLVYVSEVIRYPVIDALWLLGPPCNAVWGIMRSLLETPFVESARCDFEWRGSQGASYEEITSISGGRPGSLARVGRRNICTIQCPPPPTDTRTSCSRAKNA